MSNTLFLLIFFILWIGPVIPGVLIAKKKNRSPHWFWLSIWPGVGIWVLIIMSILDHYVNVLIVEKLYQMNQKYVLSVQKKLNPVK